MADLPEGNAEKIILTISSRGVGFLREGDEWVKGSFVGPSELVPVAGSKRLTPAELLDALRGPLGA